MIIKDWLRNLMLFQYRKITEEIEVLCRAIQRPIFLVYSKKYWLIVLKTIQEFKKTMSLTSGYRTALRTAGFGDRRAAGTVVCHRLELGAVLGHMCNATLMAVITTVCAVHTCAKKNHDLLHSPIFWYLSEIQPLSNNVSSS